MKQTAVEWLVNQILDNQGDIITNAFKYGIDLTGFVNQAKEMEKYQIVTAYKCGKVESNFPPEQFTTGYMYYEETFKSE